MATITLRNVKGSPLTNQELDDNFSNLNTDVGNKLPLTGGTLTGNLSLNSGNLDVKGTFKINGSLSGYVGFAAASAAGSTTYTLPSSDGLNGYVLATNGSGTLQWIAQTGGGGGGGGGSGTSTSRTTYVATAGQTSFAVTYTVGQIDVFVNGVKLVIGTEVTCTTGTTAVLAVAAKAGDIFEAVVYSSQWLTSLNDLYYTTGNIGIGTNNPTEKLEVTGNIKASGTGFFNGITATGTVTLSGGTANGVAYLNASKVVTSGSALTFDGTNLGIGTNTATQKLDVRGSIYVQRDSNPTNAVAVSITNQTTTSNNGCKLSLDAYNIGSSGIGVPTDSAALAFYTNGITSEKARIDTSGNFGLGLTPNAWGTGFKAFELGRLGSAFMANTVSSGLHMMVNAYYDGTNYLYANSSSYALRYLQAGSIGAHQWFTAPSGTAGGTVTFTQAMTLDASGNLGLGIAATNYTANARTFHIDGGANSAQIRLTNNTTGSTQINGGLLSMDGNSFAMWNVENDILKFGTNDQERMRLDASGNLGLGVTPSALSASFRAIEVGRIGSGVMVSTTSGNTNLTANAYQASGGWTYANSSYAGYYNISAGAGVHTWAVAPSGTAGSLVSFTTAMTLDNSGNLGLGVTPSAWSGYKAFELSNNSFINFQTVSGGFGAINTNAYYGSGGYTRNASGYAAQYYQQDGKHVWQTAGTAGAGTAITFTQAMTLDASGNLGVGETSPNSYRLNLKTAVAQGINLNGTNTGGSWFLFSNNGTANGYIASAYHLFSGGSATDFAIRAENNLSFGTGGTERARITSNGNLLVGTIASNARLEVYRESSANTVSTSASIIVGNRDQTSGTFMLGGIFGNAYRDVSTSSIVAGMWFEAANGVAGAAAKKGAVVFGTQDYGSDYNTPTERMRLDAAGNLGLGTTPSGWGQTGSIWKALQLGATAAISGRTGNEVVYLSSNTYFDGANWKYIASGNYASLYFQAASTHAWFIAPIGTSGNNIAFTQAMTLGSSGNLGIGSLSPGAKLDVVTGAVTGISVTGNTTSWTGADIYVARSGSEDGGVGKTAAIQLSNSTTNSNVIIQQFSANLQIYNFTAANGWNERIRVTSDGNLLVGTITNPADAPTGAAIATKAIYVNRTNTVTGSSSVINLSHSGGNYYGIMLQNTANSGSTALTFINSSGTTIGGITVDTTATAYNVTSDYRLKTFISNVVGSGMRLEALNPIEFEWKETGKRARGFFAHEFQKIYPSSVVGEKDAVDKDGNPIYQAMQSSTSEVIADLVAEIKSLRARVAQLEKV